MSARSGPGPRKRGSREQHGRSAIVHNTRNVSTRGHIPPRTPVSVSTFTPTTCKVIRVWTNRGRDAKVSGLKYPTEPAGSRGTTTAPALSVPRMAAAASAPRCSHNPTRTPLAESLAHALVSATLCCAARGLTWAVTSVRAIWFAQRLSSPQVVLRVTGLPVAWTSVLDHCELTTLHTELDLHATTLARPLSQLDILSRGMERAQWQLRAAAHHNRPRRGDCLIVDDCKFIRANYRQLRKRHFHSHHFSRPLCHSESPVRRSLLLYVTTITSGIPIIPALMHDQKKVKVSQIN